MSKLLQDVQYYDKYSRYRYDLNRREDWSETVERVTDYLFSFDSENVITKDEREEVYNAVYNKDVMPSMRNLSMSGEAAQRQNACSYNCAAHQIDDLYRFYETVVILMSGSGLGYSVENKHISKLPIVKKANMNQSPILFRIPDTTEGWAEAVYFGICEWYSGNNVIFDYSEIRPAGSILKVKGGRASGSNVLKTSLTVIEKIIKSKQGRKLSSLDVHDIMCHIAKCIVSGGVRRAAMIAIFDLDDDKMMTCKDSENIRGNEQRYLSNNSAVFDKELSEIDIAKFMDRMFDSYSGEPGIFSRYAIRKSLPERRKYDDDFIPNPCGEIILRGSGQFCNLSSVVCRPEDTITSLKYKVKIAVILGTLQAMSQNFPGLRVDWELNQIEERLLGVDLNGVMDLPLIQDADILQLLNNEAIYTNKVYADKLNINPATAVTCIKPSGNASVMLNTSPGIHARWSDYYIRRIQLNESNPILGVLEMNNVPVEKSNHLENTYVASFPVKSPDGAITNGTHSSLEQLENWKLFKQNWAEHSVSCTISYKEDEKEDIVNWVYNNQDIISGLSFLPKDDAVYEQMPYEKITKAQYEDLIIDFPEDIDWRLLHVLETEDMTNASQNMACTSDKCLVTF